MVGLFEAEDLAAGPVHFKSRERKKKDLAHFQTVNLCVMIGMAPGVESHD